MGGSAQFLTLIPNMMVAGGRPVLKLPRKLGSYQEYCLLFSIAASLFDGFYLNPIQIYPKPNIPRIYENVFLVTSQLFLVISNCFGNFRTGSLKMTSPCLDLADNVGLRPWHPPTRIPARTRTMHLRQTKRL